MKGCMEATKEQGHEWSLAKHIETERRKADEELLQVLNAIKERDEYLKLNGLLQPSNHELRLRQQPNWLEMDQDSGPPITEFILKIAELCNIACDYCYMYQGADQSFKKKPKQMHLATIDAFAELLANYTLSAKIKNPLIIWHGGEPLLRDLNFLRTATAMIQSFGAGNSKPQFNIQTNGTLLTADHLDFFNETNTSVGISLDGGRAANDRHRLFKNKTSSFELVDRALQLISRPEYKHLLAGILCTIDILNDPIATYEELKAYNPRSLEFLLPLGNWTHQPPFRSTNQDEAPYGDWLIAVFDRWAQDIEGRNKDIQAAKPARHVPRVRLFEEIISRHLGVGTNYEALGSDNMKPRNMVVDSDGTLHLVDSLKTTREGMTDLGISVFQLRKYGIGEASQIMRSKIKRLGMTALAEQCQACPVKHLCGGGYYPMRYDESNAQAPFDRAPIYHPDYLKLINHIVSKM